MKSSIYIPIVVLLLIHSSASIADGGTRGALEHLARGMFLVASIGLVFLILPIGLSLRRKSFTKKRA